MSCSNTQCTSKRRYIRRELANWSRKAAMVVGLEAIAEICASSKDWISQRPSSSLCLSAQESEDFDPHSPCAQCVSADTKRCRMSTEDSGNSSNSSSTEDSSNVDVLLSLANEIAENGNLLTEHELTAPQSTALQLSFQFEMMSQMHLLGMMTPSVPQPQSQGQISQEIQRMFIENSMQQQFNPMLAQQQLMWQQMMVMQMQNAHRMQIETTAKGKPQETPTIQEVREEAPLDLSRKSGLEALLEIEAMGTNKKKPDDDSMSVDEKSGCSLKRNYSQVDLNAAVNDIRNGKLGTRRASVVYGIPRSTLRNKIYKLEAADESSGTPIVFKRRRPGGQSCAQKKLADEIEREKRSTISKSRSSSISPSSDISSESNMSEGGAEETQMIEKPEALMNPLALAPLMASEPWAKGIWESLFSGSVPTNMTPEIMACGGKRKKTDELADWKRQRPKRGQYRKYDKHALDEAVQSVRRGEMSVHRAGSFYGVPHSTLEYKVKERNLMRKRKCEEGEGAAKSPEEPHQSTSQEIIMPHLHSVLSV